MWIIAIILGAALVLAGIFAKSLNRTLRTVLTITGGVCLSGGIVYFILTLILLNGIQ